MTFENENLDERAGDEKRRRECVSAEYGSPRSGRRAAAEGTKREPLACGDESGAAEGQSVHRRRMRERLRPQERDHEPERIDDRAADGGRSEQHPARLRGDKRHARSVEHRRVDDGRFLVV
ncbi:MAG: hypothetical protein IAI48_15750 [Candidatus Eremiobacteraeota bacterium]|nr:hypothetical protein [Candidatus Eremiobacteraeota bacterium]